MSKSLPNPGTYLARRTAMMVVEESKEGAILLQIPYALCAPGINFIEKHMLVLVKKDGTPQGMAQKNLMKAFPEWNGEDFFDLETIPLKEGEFAEAPEFELADCYHDEYTPANSPEGTPPQIRFKAQWFNAIGGTQNMPTPMNDDDRKRLRSKYLGKFKALLKAGTGAATPAAPKAPAAATQAAPAPAAQATPAKPAAKGPPSRKAGSPASAATPRTSTAEEVWDAFSKANADAGDEANGTRYWAAAEEVGPGKDGNLDPQEWGRVADALGI